MDVRGEESDDLSGGKPARIFEAREDLRDVVEGLGDR